MQLKQLAKLNNLSPNFHTCKQQNNHLQLVSQFYFICDVQVVPQKIELIFVNVWRAHMHGFLCVCQSLAQNHEKKIFGHGLIRRKTLPGGLTSTSTELLYFDFFLVVL